MLALIDAFGAQNAVVVGHDWGAAAVYSAAGQDPSKISKLVVLSIPHPRGIFGDSSILWEAPHFLYYQLPWSERLLWSNDFAHIKRIYKTWAPSYDPPDDVIEDVKTTFRVPGATASTLGYYWAARKADPAQQEAAAAKSIVMPALVISGTEDAPMRGPWFEKARPAFTGPYTFVTLPGVGHFPQLEAPEKTADAIVTFLGPPQP